MKIQRTSSVIMSKDRKYILAGSATSRSFIPAGSTNKMIVSYESRKKAESNIDNYVAWYAEDLVEKEDREVVEVQEILTDDIGSVSDGYHTFDELYEHRVTLYIAFCRVIASQADVKLCSVDSVPYSVLHPERSIWRSKVHSNGSSFEGWFVLGIGRTYGNQITYHIPMKYWDDTEFADTLDKAPEYDGHSSQDVLQRIRDVFIKVSN